jgi:hypothetical protein
MISGLGIVLRKYGGVCGKREGVEGARKGFTPRPERVALIGWTGVPKDGSMGTPFLHEHSLTLVGKTC